MLINRQFEELFHVSKEDVVGKTDHDLFPEEVAREFRKNDLHVLATQVPVQFDEVAPHDRPSLAMLVLSWTGLVLLGGTAVVYSVSLLR